MKFDLDITKYTPDFIETLISQVMYNEPEKISGSIVKEILASYLEGRKDNLTQEQYASLLALLSAKFRDDQPRFIKNALVIGNKYVRVRSMFKALSNVRHNESRNALFLAMVENLFDTHMKKPTKYFKDRFMMLAKDHMELTKMNPWRLTRPMQPLVPNELLGVMGDSEFAEMIAGLFNVAATTDLLNINTLVISLGQSTKYNNESIDKRLIRLADTYDIFSIMDRPRATQCINNIVKQVKEDNLRRANGWHGFKQLEEVNYAIIYFLMNGDEKRFDALKFELKLGR